MRVNAEALRQIESKVQSLSDNELLEQFHYLIDKRLDEALTFLEALELDRIEARLDEQDETEANRLGEFQNAWASERSALLRSIEQLLAALKAE